MRALAAVLAFFTRLVLRYYYGSWARLYRRLFEREFTDGSAHHRDMHLHAVTFPTMGALATYVVRRVWMYKPDAWKQLFDAVSHPARAYAVFESKVEAPSGLDCDEFAAWSALVVDHNAAHWGVKSAHMLCFTWLGEKGIAGHNTCFVEWLDGTFSSFDYGSTGPRFTTREEVVTQVLRRYTKTGHLLAWALYDPRDMALVELH